MPRLTVVFMDNVTMTFDGDNYERWSFLVTLNVLKITVGKTIYYYPLHTVKHFTFEEK